jgi:uncharacterized FlaG/YvyC family protein
MTIEQLLKKIEIINRESKYWMVRTNSGLLFDEYFNKGYISIGWDYLTLDELKNKDDKYIKAKIARSEGFDSDKTSDKIKITSSYNKLCAFLNLKKDDVILIPSRNTDRIAFGRVADDEIYEDDTKKEDGSFYKKRKIIWYEVKNIRFLNPIFYQIKSNHHSISNIDKYAPYIDRVMGSLYIKNDSTHFVLNIEKNENINFEDLKTLMDNINILVKSINEEFGFNENLDEFYIKINLNSKGTVELIKAGKSLAVLAYILSLVSCGNTYEERNQNINNIINNNDTELSKTTNVLDTLQADISSLTNTFKNGK